MLRAARNLIYKTKEFLESINTWKLIVQRKVFSEFILVLG
jgi:hypothetical protein